MALMADVADLFLFTGLDAQWIVLVAVSERVVVQRREGSGHGRSCLLLLACALIWRVQDAQLLDFLLHEFLVVLNGS